MITLSLRDLMLEAVKSINPTAAPILSEKLTSLNDTESLTLYQATNCLNWILAETKDNSFGVRKDLQQSLKQDNVEQWVVQYTRNVAPILADFFGE